VYDTIESFVPLFKTIFEFSALHLLASGHHHIYTPVDMAGGLKHPAINNAHDFSYICLSRSARLHLQSYLCQISYFGRQSDSIGRNVRRSPRGRKWQLSQSETLIFNPKQVIYMFTAEYVNDALRTSPSVNNKSEYGRQLY
jgi:hypothetical protein